MSNIGRFVAELRRRKVFRTAGIYLIGAWAAIQVASETAEPLGLPPWTATFVVWAVVIGFPLTLLFGWRYELGPTGVSLTMPTTDEPVDPKLKAADYLILTLVALVIGIAAYGVVDRDSVSVETRIVADMIAVLPFVVDGDGAEDDYLVRGLADELRNRLGDFPGIRVAGRRSSEVYRDSLEDPITIATSLGVSTLIEGRVRSSDGRLSVSLDITDGPSGRLLWGNRFERPMSDLVALEREIVTAVVAVLTPSSEFIATSIEPKSDSAEALDYFFLARNLDHQVRDSPVIDLDMMYEAIGHYVDAIDADRNMAEAYAYMANALLFIDQPDVAGEAILKAETLDPDSAVVQHTLASYRMTKRLPRIEEAYRAAIALDPNNPEALEDYGVFLWHQGDNITPEDLFRRAIELDRLAFFPYARLGHLYAVNGRVDDALEVATRIERLFKNAKGYMQIAEIYELVGLLDEAIVWARRAKEAEPGLEQVDWQLAQLYARLHDFDTARLYEPERSVGKLYWQQRYQELIELVDEQILEQSGELRALYLAAFGHIALGAHENAVYIYQLLVAGLAGERMPRIAMHESHVASSTEHLVHYAGALEAIGRDEDAAAAAQWVVDFTNEAFATGNSVDWWATTLQSCALIVLDKKEKALDLLPRIKSSPGLPWYPLLKDSWCFRQVADDPRYIDVVRNVESRIDEIRRRLPDTLRAHGLDP